MDLDRAVLKQTLKEALVEVLQEQRELFHEVFLEVLEDLAMVEAIREGQQSELTTREVVFRVLRGQP